MEKLLTMGEAVDILHLRKKHGWKTVQNYMTDGSLPCVNHECSLMGSTFLSGLHLGTG